MDINNSMNISGQRLKNLEMLHMYLKCSHTKENINLYGKMNFSEFFFISWATLAGIGKKNPTASAECTKWTVSISTCFWLFYFVAMLHNVPHKWRPLSLLFEYLWRKCILPLIETVHYIMYIILFDNSIYCTKTWVMSYTCTLTNPLMASVQSSISVRSPISVFLWTCCLYWIKNAEWKEESRNSTLPNFCYYHKSN